jgi:hypothetical protein
MTPPGFTVALRSAVCQRDEEYVRTIYAFPWHGRDPSVGFPGGQTPSVGLPDNYLTQNLADEKLNNNSTWKMIQRILLIRKEFQVSQRTRIKVRDDLYGHVLGYTLINPDQPGRESKSCLTMIVNFDSRGSYQVPSRHEDAGCGAADELILEKNATIRDRQAFLSPYGMVILE